MASLGLSSVEALININRQVMVHGTTGIRPPAQGRGAFRYVLKSPLCYARYFFRV